MSKKQKTWIAAGVSVVVIIALVLVIASIRSQNNSSAATYQTTTVEIGTLTSSVEGSGIVASTQSANLAWKTSGQVDQVMAQIGNQVKAGDVLATLLQDSLTQSTLETNLVTAQENLAELTSPEAIANAKLAVTTAQADVINAQYKLNNQQYWKNDALIKDQYSNLVIAKAILDQAQEAYDSAHVGEYINNPGEAALYQALYNAQQKYDIAEFNYSLYSQKPTERQLNEAQATLDLANATLAEDKAYLAALTGGDVPADATGTSLLKLKQARLAVQTAQENLDAAKLTAPFSGTITEVSGMVGDLVSPGTSGFRMDDLSHLLVDVQVSEVDINSVSVGQPAVVTFDAVLGREYHGKVIEVSRVGTSVQSVVNFSVTVELTDPDADVKPGMTASVTITIQSLDNVLLVPNGAVHLVSGQRVVYVLRNGQLFEIPVTLGASDDTRSEVTSGDLSAGDVLVLNPPADFTPGQGGSPRSIFGGG